jgi:hypothetical protein
MFVTRDNCIYPRIYSGWVTTSFARCATKIKQRPFVLSTDGHDSNRHTELNMQRYTDDTNSTDYGVPASFPNATRCFRTESIPNRLPCLCALLQ